MNQKHDAHALTRNGLAELRIRSARQRAKAHSNQRSKTELQEKAAILLQNSKTIEKLLTSGIIKEGWRSNDRDELKEYGRIDKND